MSLPRNVVLHVAAQYTHDMSCNRPENQAGRGDHPFRVVMTNADLSRLRVGIVVLQLLIGVVFGVEGLVRLVSITGLSAVFS